MPVPAIALLAAPLSYLCPAPYNSCQISSSAGSPEFDFNARNFSSCTASSSYLHKPAITGGLSRLFSSSPPFCFSFEELRHDCSEELGSSFSYSVCSTSSSYKCRDQSPVSVFRGPISCSGSSCIISVGTSRNSPPSRLPCDWSFSDSTAGRDVLFNGFVRNALGSSLDYNSTRAPISGSSNFDVEDLTFNLEDGFSEVQPTCEPYAHKLLSLAQSRHEIFHEVLVLKAFSEAEKAHRGQMRMSGDPYLQHCVETAVLLAQIGANPTIVAAGLLHDTLDDSFVDYNYILKIFGAGVADLVEEVSKLSQLSKLARQNNTASRKIEADRLHTIYLATADARAILIKLADRLHNMMTLDFLSMAKQQRFAMETLQIFSPLANRLGLSSWKEILENLCFKYLYPEEHKELSFKLLSSFDESKIKKSKEMLEQALKNGDLQYHVISGRRKSLFAIYSKMIRKKLPMDEIHDIYGLRLIVEKEQDCYQALKVVHQLWPDILGRVKDYIIHPKYNGYQSLHSVVKCEDKLPLEVQIRTKAMHQQAECGFAAHWRYKECDSEHSNYILQIVDWARCIVTWHCEMMDMEKPSSFSDAHLVRPICPFHPDDGDSVYSYAHTHQRHNDEPIFIIMLENEKMSVHECPLNSTVTDLLERFGRANRGDQLLRFTMKEELRPRINHEPVCHPKQKLRMGDVVELTPDIPHKSLTEYREEIKRMYDHGVSVPTPGALRS